MTEYRISNSMYKRIQERKRRFFLLIALSIFLQLLIAFVCMISGRDGIIIGCTIEPVFLILVCRCLCQDIRAVKHNNRTGIITKKIADRSINRSGVISGNAYGGWRGEVKYILYVDSSGEQYNIKLPSKDAFLTYDEGDEVLLVEFLPYPVITSRIPQAAACPQCASLLHYEDGACHNCGLDDIYPDFCTTPKWEGK